MKWAGRISREQRASYWKWSWLNDQLRQGEINFEGRTNDLEVWELQETVG